MDWIHQLTLLRHLDLTGTNLADLPTSLTLLENLEALYLSYAQEIEDFDLVGTLVWLRELRLDNTQVDDLQFINGMTKLEKLCVWCTSVSDLFPIAHLTKLKSLDVGDTQVTSLEPLEGLTGLVKLDITKNRVHHLNSLSKLKNLEVLILNETSFDGDLKVLSQLKNLKTLSMANTSVNDLSPLAGLSKLNALNILGTDVQSFSPLQSLEFLDKLCFENEKVNGCETRRNRPLLIVAHLIEEFFSSASPAELEQGQYSIHTVVNGIEALLPGSQLLSEIPSTASTYGNPLIITSGSGISFTQPLLRFHGNEAVVFVHPKYLSTMATFKSFADTIQPGVKNWQIYSVNIDGNLSSLDSQTLVGHKKFFMAPASIDVLSLKISPPGSTKYLCMENIEECGYSPRWDGEGGTVLPKQNSQSSTFESIDPSSPMTLPRLHCLSLITTQLETSPVLLIRAPPSSGKTSTALLLEGHLLKSIGLRVVRISCLWLMQSWGTVFNDAWSQLFGISFEEWKTQPISTIVLIDEAQILYTEYLDFWDGIKLMGQGRYPFLKIVLFAAYGYHGVGEFRGTPVDITACLGLNDLCLSEEEAGVFMTAYFAEKRLFSEDINEAAGLLFSMTSGHVGLCKNIMESVHNQVVYTGRQNRLIGELIKLFNSPRTYSAVYSARAFHNFHELSRDRIGCMEAIRKLFHQGFLLNNIPNRADLLTYGFVREENDKLVLFAPIAAVYLKSIVLGSFQQSTNDPNSLHEFVISVCRNMNASTLSESLGKTVKDGTPLERLWQMEFWRGGMMALGPNSILSPDVGALFGVKGFIDFTVQCHYNPMRSTFLSFWGIELLREGKSLNEHCQRFDVSSGGKYSKLVDAFDEFVIIDFRKFRPRTFIKNVIYVVYSTDFSSMDIMGEGMKETSISLLQ
ncbi:hypothetical protein HDU79_003846 [Rhizoclosmatium sp. JEL0117]|nr:hypothetical protein HDU79_003846 [Rhizoclosmatium sp. JEL0117]